MRFRFLIVLLMAISLSALAACGGSSDAEESRRLATQVNTLTAANEALTAEKAELQAQVETLAEQIAGLTDSSDAPAAEKAELQAQVETLTERVAALTDTNDALASQKVELDAQVETLAEQVATLTDANDALASEKAELQAHVEALTTQVAALTETGHASADEAAELQAQVETLAEQVAVLTDTNDALGAEKAELEAQVEMLTEQVTTLTEEHEEEATVEDEPTPQPEPLLGEWQEWTAEWTDSSLNRVAGYGFLLEGTSNKSFDEPILILRCLNEKPDVSMFTDEILSYEDNFSGLIRLGNTETSPMNWSVFGDYSNNIGLQDWALENRFIPYLLDNAEMGTQLHIAAPNDGYVASFDVTGVEDVLAAMPCFAQLLDAEE